MTSAYAFGLIATSIGYDTKKKRRSKYKIEWKYKKRKNNTFSPFLNCIQYLFVYFHQLQSNVKIEHRNIEISNWIDNFARIFAVNANVMSKSFAKHDFKADISCFDKRLVFWLIEIDRLNDCLLLLFSISYHACYIMIIVYYERDRYGTAKKCNSMSHYEHFR